MTKFYRCAICGNIVEMIEDKHVPVFSLRREDAGIST